MNGSDETDQTSDVMDTLATTRDEIDLDDMNAAWDRIKADQVFLDPLTSTTFNGPWVEHAGGDIIENSRYAMLNHAHVSC
jgi:hypothetical protein